MIFQFIVTFSLLVVVVYGLRIRRSASSIAFVTVAVSLTGIGLVWHPDLASRLARAVGIGRGADLLFYCWIVVNLVLILNLHIKHRYQAERMTEIVRYLALMQRSEASTSRRGPAEDMRAPDGIGDTVARHAETASGIPVPKLPA